MNTDVKQLLRDLNAAVVISRSEAVNLALDGLLQLPGVLSNDHMENAFLEQVILPVSRILSVLPPNHIRQLLKHELVAGRAVGAAAITHRFIKYQDVLQADVDLPASDRRLEVRTVLVKTLTDLIEVAPEKVFELGTQWLQKSSPRYRSTALSLYPKLYQFYNEQIINLLLPMIEEEDPDVRGILARSLSEIARDGFQTPVLNLLLIWSKDEKPNIWVICKTLSRSWAANYPVEVESILRKLQNKTQETSLIKSTQKALRRHGADINL